MAQHVGTTAAERARRRAAQLTGTSSGGEALRCLPAGERRGAAGSFVGSIPRKADAGFTFAVCRSGKQPNEQRVHAQSVSHYVSHCVSHCVSGRLRMAKRPALVDAS